MDNVSLERAIKQRIPDAVVEIVDLTGSGSSFEATVVSQEFAGKSRINCHKMVYSALAEELKSEIHALKLVTLVPEQQ